MKGRISNTGSVNETVGQKYSTTGHQRFVPLREYDGKDAQGNHTGREAWVDMHTQKAYEGGPNWEKAPPLLPSGDPGRELRCRPPSRAYRDKYAKIFGHE